MVEGKRRRTYSRGRAEQREWRQDPRCRCIFDCEKYQLVGSPDKTDRAARSRKRQRQERCQEAPLARPLHDPERERDTTATRCDEPREAAPVLPESEPAKHRERRPYARQLAAGGESGECPRYDHPSVGVEPQGHRNGQEGADLKHHREHVSTDRGADEQATIRRREKAGQGNRERPGAAQLPQDDEDEDK
jgi:hypothetical protein